MRLACLDPFGDHAEPELLCEPRRRMHDHPILPRDRQARHEALVDLELVRRERLQVRERRVTGTEVVDGDLRSRRYDSVEDGFGSLGIHHDRGLGQLDAESARVDLVPA